jgi:hypothetical protein
MMGKGVFRENFQGKCLVADGLRGIFLLGGDRKKGQQPGGGRMPG